MTLDLRDVLKDGNINRPPLTSADLDERANADASPLTIALLSLDDCDRDDAIVELWSWARDRRDEYVARQGRALVDLPADLFEVSDHLLRLRAAWRPTLKPLVRMVKP